MLRQVLGSKVRRATELKRNLGITPFKEFKQDLQTGINQIKESTTYVLVAKQWPLVLLRLLCVVAPGFDWFIIAFTAIRSGVLVCCC